MVVCAKAYYEVNIRMLPTLSNEQVVQTIINPFSSAKNSCSQPIHRGRKYVQPQGGSASLCWPEPYIAIAFIHIKSTNVGRTKHFILSCEHIQCRSVPH